MRKIAKEKGDALNRKLQFTCRLWESIKRDIAESIDRFREIDRNAFQSVSSEFFLIRRDIWLPD